MGAKGLSMSKSSVQHTSGPNLSTVKSVYLLVKKTKSGQGVKSQTMRMRRPWFKVITSLKTGLSLSLVQPKICLLLNTTTENSVGF